MQTIGRSPVRRLGVLFLMLVVPMASRAQIAAGEYAERRAALLAALPDAVVVVLGAAESSLDYLEFYQSPNMLYLSGIREPDAALVLVKEAGRVSGTAFVLPRDPAAEVWTGTRMGTDGAARWTGLPARASDQLHGMLDSLARGRLPMYFVADLTLRRDSLAISPHDQLVAALRRAHPQLVVSSAAPLVEQLRGRKSPAELALIRRAVEITVAAQAEAFRTMRAGAHEYEVEAAIEHTFRRSGAERPSFATIVGSGPNATTLHYTANDRLIQRGDVVVMDIGASFNGYSADVTRTVPATGTFTPEQRQVYQIVRDAQSAAERLALPGMSAQVMSDSASAVIAAGLTRLGLIESPAATYDIVARDGSIRQASQVGLYYMHGLGHGIGLEVHDPEQFYYSGVIAQGSAFTIEPGIYVRSNLLEILPDTPRNRALIAKIRPAVERYRNVGVRIEDDYIVTDKGLEWISRAPREISEIEAVMRRVTP
jgi:Xaa-Pro aminopeptidase